MTTLSDSFISPSQTSLRGGEWKRTDRPIHIRTQSRLHRSPLFLSTGDVYIFFFSMHFNKPLESKTRERRNFYLKFKTGIKRNRLFSSYVYIFFLHFQTRVSNIVFSFFLRCVSVWFLRSMVTIDLLWSHQARELPFAKTYVFDRANGIGGAVGIN